MEQNALYYKIPYVKEFDTEVLTCRSVDDPEIRKSVFGQDGAERPLYAVYLRDHGFYPEGGGQASDTGSLQGITEELSCRVCSVQEVKAEADGSYTVSADIFGKGILMLLLSQGRSVEVKSPSSLRAAWHNEAQLILNTQEEQKEI